MLHRVFRTALVGLVIAVIFIGCEEVAEKPDYRPADAHAITQRWGRAIALGVSFRASEAVYDARQYGACEVFDIHASYPEVSVFSFLDCLDRTEHEPGHYHLAAVCIAERQSGTSGTYRSARAVYVRAGERDRRMCRNGTDSQGHCLGPDDPVYGFLKPITVGIDGAWHQFTVTEHMLYKWDEALYASLVDRIAEGSGDLAFSIYHDGHVDTGTSALTSNDAAAAAEHRSRCHR